MEILSAAKDGKADGQRKFTRQDDACGEDVRRLQVPSSYKHTRGVDSTEESG